MPAGPRPIWPNRSCKLVISGTYEEATWQNVMWLYLTGSGEITTSDLDSLADQAISNYGSRFSNVCQENWLSKTAEVTLSFGGELFDGFGESISSGTDDGPDMPASVAACISWRITPHYRGGHPRTYLCGLAQTTTVGSTNFNGTFISACEDAAIEFHNDLEGLGPIGDGIETVEHGIVSFVRDGQWREPPVFYRIHGARVDSRVDTQRRRLGRDRVA